ncbi:hypothetical protein, partial [Nocardia amamiensis]|uniref:hypothetical protein n=1 Tax=Nocardia amamiensis TaxID=404578 RepID=UPI0033F7E544
MREQSPPAELRAAGAGLARGVREQSLPAELRAAARVWREGCANSHCLRNYGRRRGSGAGVREQSP